MLVHKNNTSKFSKCEPYYKHEQACGEVQCSWLMCVEVKVSKALAISGAQTYQELCIAAKNEEMASRIEKKKAVGKERQSTKPYQQNNQQDQTPQLRKDDQRGKSTFRKQTKCYW